MAPTFACFQQRSHQPPKAGFLVPNDLWSLERKIYGYHQSHLRSPPPASSSRWSRKLPRPTHPAKVQVDWDHCPGQLSFRTNSIKLGAICPKRRDFSIRVSGSTSCPGRGANRLLFPSRIETKSLFKSRNQKDWACDSLVVSALWVDTLRN